MKQVRQLEVRIDAWVVLPDHMQSTAGMQELGQRMEQLPSIWTLPAGDDQYSNRWRAIKKPSRNRYLKPNIAPQSRIKRHECGIWQRRFWEHTIIDDADYAAHVDYIHHNPVKHGWTVTVKDWPYSSFHRLVKMDIYPLNWAGLDLALLEAGEPDN